MAHAGRIYGRAGATNKAQALLDSLLALSEREHVKASHISAVHSGLCSTDEMFARLDKAYETRSDVLVWFQANFGGYRDEPRYIDLARRINFPME